MGGISFVQLLPFLLAFLQEGSNADPVGPSGWGLRSWIGFFLYILIFIGAVALIFWIARGAEEEEEETSKPGEKG